MKIAEIIWHDGLADIEGRSGGGVANETGDKKSDKSDQQGGRAALEKKRIVLTLRERRAAVADQYANARLMAVEDRDEMLPRAKKAYSLMVEKYGRMLASYPGVLDVQRKLYDLQIEYIAALEGVWTKGIALQGYLLTDGLEAPARPGEVDRPVRETNVPMPARTAAPLKGGARRP